MEHTAYTVLDLFSGAGGLTEGFCQAGGFDMIAHVEMNKWAAKSLETRMLYHSLKRLGNMDIYHKYMRNYDSAGSRDVFLKECRDLGLGETGVINMAISLENRDDIARIISDNLKTAEKKRIDVVIGGPPCQAYSIMRRWQHCKDTSLSDQRLYLYRHYLHYLKTFRPRMFVFENVPGLGSIDSGMFMDIIKNNMKSAGYHVKLQILNAADFGVLQNRKRIIIIGWKKNESLEIPEFVPNRADATIHDLIMEDLPVLDAGSGEDVQNYRAPPTRYLQEYGIRRPEDDVLLHHIARPNCERDLEIYRRAILAMKEGIRLKYTDLPIELRTHANTTSFLDRFKVVDEHSCSHSVVAHISRDGHYYIHPDINHPRSLTVREAARIQSFPDDYIFEGPRGPRYVQIGNAVPPLMAKGIAELIYSCMQSLF